MELRLIRRGFTAKSTEGDLYVDGELYCQTLEDVVRDGQKVFGKTAIPAGTYEVIVSWSNRFKKELPLLLDVAGFAGVRIHSGNKPEDTEGCILVGKNRGVHPDAKEYLDSWISESRVTFDALFPKIKAACKTKKVWLHITNDTPRMAA